MAVISFALYNGNYNLYSAVRFIFEVTPGGAIVPSYSMRVLKLDLYDNVRDFNQAFDNYLVIVDIALHTLVFRCSSSSSSHGRASAGDTARAPRTYPISGM